MCELLQQLTGSCTRSDPQALFSSLHTIQLYDELSKRCIFLTDKKLTKVPIMIIDFSSN